MLAAHESRVIDEHSRALGPVSFSLPAAEASSLFLVQHKRALSFSPPEITWKNDSVQSSPPPTPESCTPQEEDAAG